MGDGSLLPASTLAALYARRVDGAALDDLLRHVCGIVVEVLPGADESSVTLVRGGQPATLGATSEVARLADLQQYELGGGPCLDAAVGSQLVRVPDLAADVRWPAAPKMAAVGAGSTLSFPLPIQADVVGALNLYGRAPRAFDADSEVLGVELASHAAVVVANAVSYSTAAEQAQQLRQAMESRAVIEQAKGIIIATTGCDAEEAFHLLVQQSQHENRKLRDVAAELVRLKSGAG